MPYNRHYIRVDGAGDIVAGYSDAFPAGSTAPLFHPMCRCTTVPYFDDDDADDERITHDEDGETYYVPEDMTYEEWNSSTLTAGR